MGKREVRRKSSLRLEDVIKDMLRRKVNPNELLS